MRLYYIMKIITFYCDVDGKDYYSRCSKNLEQMCSTFDIEVDMVEKESLGSYRDNCLSKPKFILEKLSEYREPVCWIDVDTVFKKRPDAFFNCPLDRVDVVFASANQRFAGIKASPIVFNYNEKSVYFLKSWINESAKVSALEDRYFDHETLFKVIHEKSDTIEYGLFDGIYCVWPGYTDEQTVIEMGLSDVDSKIDGLRKMGVDEELIKWQTTGIL